MNVAIGISGPRGNIEFEIDNNAEGVSIKFMLPSFKKVKIDMKHIVSGHTAGGGRGDDNKDKFPPGMSEAAIAKAIQVAYKNAEKVSSLQYSWQNGVEVVKQKFQGIWDGIIIEFWFNYTTNQIDTAYLKW